MSNSLKYVFRVVVGVIFLISSIAKIVSIDSFELYLFSFEILPLSLTFLFARLVIAFELALGIYLILNSDSQIAYTLSFLFLAAMSGFLIGLIIAGRKDNCNCFGDLLDMNPWESLIKNVVILALLRLSGYLKPFKIWCKPLWRVLIPVAAIATVFIVRPPDNWYYDRYSSVTSFNQEEFQKDVDASILPPQIMEGEKVVCFYSNSCEFCKMSAQKIGTMRRMGTFSNGEIIAFFGMNKVFNKQRQAEKEADATEKVKAFLEETKLDCDNYQFLDAKEFLRITNGSFPLILVLKDGEVINKYSYRDIR